MIHDHYSYMDVRWSDLDLLGHVNNVVYLTYFENARAEWYGQYNAEMRAAAATPVIVQCNISYRASAIHPCQLQVVTSLSTLGRTSMVIHQSVQERDSGKVFCDAQVTSVWLSRENNAKVSVPDFIRAWVE